MNWEILKFAFITMLVVCPLFAFANTGGDEDCVSETTEICVEQDIELPKVFLIGEYAEEFDAASAEYNLQLIDACKQDMNIAYIKWLSMLQEMEDYAETLDGFEIKGVKMWIKVFWDTNGTIDHIAYYLKPHSRNVDVNELTAFFMAFMNQYEFPLIAEEKFSNYGSAAFPIVTRRKDNN